MPYTDAQCRKFAVLAKEGKKVPKDWKKYCRKDRKSIADLKISGKK